MPTTYRTFTRSATNFEQFAKARKMTVRRGLTYSEAQAMCKRFNDERTPAQVRKGTKMEFMAE
jgi:hypothetical protein